MLAGGNGTEPGLLNAYDVLNGSVKWTLNVDAAMVDKHDGGSAKAGAKDIYGSPSVGNNGDIYFIVRDLKDGGAARRLFVFAVKENGEVNWAYPGKDANVYAITPAIDADGNIYVAHRSKEIWKLTSAGACTVNKFGDSAWPGITGGMSLSKDGTAYMFGNGNTGLCAYNTSTATESWLYKDDFGTAPSPAFTGSLRSATVTVGTDGTLYSVIDLVSGKGAVIALDPNGSLKWKYETAGAIADGGVVLGEDGTVYANGGQASGVNGAGVVALNSDGSLKWHYTTESDAQTVPLIDNRGYIHFITADATYYILKPDGTLFSSQKIGDSTISSPVMDDKGNLYVSVKKDGANVMLCVTSEATSYNTNSAWPMRGQNPQRTGLQK